MISPKGEGRIAEAGREKGYCASERTRENRTHGRSTYVKHPSQVFFKKNDRDPAGALLCGNTQEATADQRRSSVTSPTGTKSQKDDRTRNLRRTVVNNRHVSYRPGEETDGSKTRPGEDRRTRSAGRGKKKIEKVTQRKSNTRNGLITSCQVATERYSNLAERAAGKAAAMSCDDRTFFPRPSQNYLISATQYQDFARCLLRAGTGDGKGEGVGRRERNLTASAANKKKKRKKNIQTRISDGELFNEAIKVVSRKAQAGKEGAAGKSHILSALQWEPSERNRGSTV